MQGPTAILSLKALLAGAFLASGAMAQTTWQTTHTTNGGWNNGSCDLARAELRVKVYPAYLDVEEDLEIATIGQVSPGNDPNTLEIVGNFRLPPGATLTGALLWDGNRLLEGKLLDRKTADSLYEKMVERNSNPPPRPLDPIIIELTAKDTYRMRIYPVKLGASRHFRLRYQLPPRIGAEGLETVLQAAVGSLFPGHAPAVPVTLEGAGGVARAILAEGTARNVMTLPRTRFMKVQDLAPRWTWDHRPPGLRILPVDPLRQVMMKTSFPSGTFAGNYVNLYAGVDEAVMRGVTRRVEVVLFWKWHYPEWWIRNTEWGEDKGTVYLAQRQAAELLELHGMLGMPGIKVGLLHDDSKTSPKSFPAANRGETAYLEASQYLRSMQGDYAENLARSVRAVSPGQGDVATAARASKSTFLSNMRLVKTLYSAETGVVRHLIMVSCGPEHTVEEKDMNDSLTVLFTGMDMGYSTMLHGGFQQAGFDAVKARVANPYRGPVASTRWGDIPGLPSMNFNVTVRNARKAYDFSIQCQGGLGLSCGTLTFHGKSDEPWRDSLEWEAFDRDGNPLGRTTTSPRIFGAPGDTGIATLWAGSESPFSEKTELPLGPVYGFVDRWASLLALEKDSLGAERARTYADTGVPRIANKELADVIPNYAGGPGGPGGPIATGVLGDAAWLSNTASWRLERAGDGMIRLLIPGLRSGARVVVEAFDLHGRRLGSWNLSAGEGMLSWKTANLAPGGVYLLKVRVDGLMAVKRITL